MHVYELRQEHIFHDVYFEFILCIQRFLVVNCHLSRRRV
jgi:hypothetical protein